MTGVVRIGVLRLTDSAPVVVAQSLGLFAEMDVSVRISIEPSWSNIADKLTYGLMDAAVMLPPLTLAAAAGLRGTAAPLIVPMGLTRGGNSIVVSNQLAGASGAASVLAGIRGAASPPRLAVVHQFSTHNLLLRYWLMRAGIDPELGVETVIMPPSDVVAELDGGRISGFCAGAPWGDQAVALGVGRLVAGTSAIWPSHPEKCLTVNADWAEAAPDTLTRLIRALLRAQKFCDQPEQAEAIVRILSDPEGLALPAEATRKALPQGEGAEHIRFFAEDAWYPARLHALWFLGQMRRWNWLPEQINLDQVASRVYRPDLLAVPMEQEGLFAARCFTQLENPMLPPLTEAGFG